MARVTNAYSSIGHKLASGAKIKGIAEFERKIRNAARTKSMQVGQAMKEEFEIEKLESMKRTPVDTGDLRDSHEVKGPIIRKDSIRVELHAGDGLGYAVRVHEDLEAFHRVGQAKFMESTLNESAPYMLRRVAARVKRNEGG